MSSALSRALASVNLGNRFVDRLRIVLFLFRSVLLEIAGLPPTRTTISLKPDGRRILVTNTGELAAMRHVLVDEEYRPLAEPETILDLGANIGVATIYFHRLYPRARIIAVEADPRTFQILRHNVGSIPGVVTVNAAIVGKDGPVEFYPSRKSLMSSTAPGTGPKTTVRGITIATLMREHELDDVGLAKIDVEGEEIEAIHAAPLPRIHEVIAEIHHEWVDTTEASLRELFVGFDLTLGPGDRPTHSLLHAWRPQAEQ